MLNQRLNVLAFSDVHLGHRKTPTRHIIQNLYKLTPDTAASSDLDMIVIPGDLFDRHLSFPQEEVFEIQSYLAYLLRLCKRRDIVLRVMEGTPSHDWKQPRVLETLNTETGINADAKYVPTLSIEHIDRFDIDILYIPDEWSIDNEDTWREVTDLMAERRLDQVDFTLMHGQFPFQLPAHVQVPTHDPDRYADLTRHYVFCGHVHKPNRYRNILVPGSTDRIAHGEEETKGAWRVLVDPDGDDEVTFIANEGACIYRTIVCTDMDSEDALSLVERELSVLPTASHIRIEARTTDPIMASLSTLQRNYPEYHWTDKRVADEAESSRMEVPELRPVQQTTPITPRTVTDLVSEQLARMDVDEMDRRGCLAVLSEVV